VFEFYENISEEDARQFCNSCETCAKYTSTKKDPHITPIVSTQPFERLQIDLKDFHHLAEWNDGICQSMSSVCHFSGMPWVHLHKSKESTLIIESLKKLFRENGTPKIVQFDNGGEFTSTELTEWLTSLGIQIIHGRPRHPQSQVISLNCISTRWHISIRNFPSQKT